jgi:hypothetical protein
MVCNAFRSINGAPVKVLTAKVREGSLGTQRTGPFHTEDRRRAPALRFGDPRVQALAGALCTTALAVTGITNRSLRALMTGLLGAATYSMNQASYDLARLRTNGLITRIPGKNRYRPASIPPNSAAARSITARQWAGSARCPRTSTHLRPASSTSRATSAASSSSLR